MFKYERFYEYFVGRSLFELSHTHVNRPVFFADLIDRITTEPFLWGAIKYALIQDARVLGLQTIEQFCLTDRQHVKEMVVSVLTDLGREDRAQVEHMLKRLLLSGEKISGIQRVRQFLNEAKVSINLPSRYAGRIAIEVASNLSIPWVLQTAAV